MKYIKGKNREQLILFPTSLEDIIEEDNEVRFTAYNLRRLMSIIGTEVLIEYLEILISLMSYYLHQFRLKISQYQQYKVFIYFSVFLYTNKIKAVRMAYTN